MTTDIPRSSRLIDLCLRTLALDDRVQLDRASIALLERSRREAEAVTARLRARSQAPEIQEALGQMMLVTACIRGLLERGAAMDPQARRRVLDEAREGLHHLDEIVDSLA